MAREMESVERIRASAAPGAGGKNPEEMSPQELHAVLWQVLTFRDSGMFCWGSHPKLVLLMKLASQL